MKNKVFKVLGEFSAIAGIMLVLRMFTESKLTVNISLDYLMLVVAVTAGSLLGKVVGAKIKLFKSETLNDFFFNIVIVAIFAGISVSIDSTVLESTAFMVNGVVACMGALVLGIGFNLLSMEK